MNSRVVNAILILALTAHGLLACCAYSHVDLRQNEIRPHVHLDGTIHHHHHGHKHNHSQENELPQGKDNPGNELILVGDIAAILQSHSPITEHTTDDSTKRWKRDNTTPSQSLRPLNSFLRTDNEFYLWYCALLL